MMDVHWLEQTDADVPPGDGWLGAAEAARLQELRFPKRRAEWRLGRWTAKRAVAGYLDLALHHAALAAVEIRAATSGAPEAFVGGKPAPVAISLSHRDGLAICAVALPGTAVGCDLEIVESHSDAFAADYFLPEERRLVADAPATERFRLLTLLWSAKESALKALHEGLRLDTRSVVATPSDALSVGGTGWYPLQVRCLGGQTFQGWWQRKGNIVQTMVAAPSPAPPVPINLRAAVPARAKPVARQA
jgi:4'-phosphopantetheinyl transferase